MNKSLHRRSCGLMNVYHDESFDDSFVEAEKDSVAVHIAGFFLLMAAVVLVAWGLS